LKDGSSSGHESQLYPNPANGMNFTLGNFNEIATVENMAPSKYDTMPVSLMLEATGASTVQQGIRQVNSFDYEKLKLQPVPELENNPSSSKSESRPALS